MERKDKEMPIVRSGKTYWPTFEQARSNAVIENGVTKIRWIGRGHQTMELRK